MPVENTGLSYTLCTVLSLIGGRVNIEWLVCLWTEMDQQYKQLNSIGPSVQVLLLLFLPGKG